jgi:hypothetical protein
MKILTQDSQSLVGHLNTRPPEYETRVLQTGPRHRIFCIKFSIMFPKIKLTYSNLFRRAVLLLAPLPCPSVQTCVAPRVIISERKNGHQIMCMWCRLICAESGGLGMYDGNWSLWAPTFTASHQEIAVIITVHYVRYNVFSILYIPFNTTYFGFI